MALVHDRMITLPKTAVFLESSVTQPHSKRHSISRVPVIAFASSWITADGWPNCWYSTSARTSHLAINKRGKTMDVLLTFTGFHDPYFKGLVDQEEQPGPILSLLSARSFDHIQQFPRFVFSGPTRIRLSRSKLGYDPQSPAQSAGRRERRMAGPRPRRRLAQKEVIPPKDGNRKGNVTPAKHEVDLDPGSAIRKFPITAGPTRTKRMRNSLGTMMLSELVFEKKLSRFHECIK
jgi:hypothetical protein